MRRAAILGVILFACHPREPIVAAAKPAPRSPAAPAVSTCSGKLDQKRSPAAPVTTWLEAWQQAMNEVEVDSRPTTEAEAKKALCGATCGQTGTHRLSAAHTNIIVFVMVLSNGSIVVHPLGGAGNAECDEPVETGVNTDGTGPIRVSFSIERQQLRFVHIGGSKPCDEGTANCTLGCLPADTARRELTVDRATGDVLTECSEQLPVSP